MSRDNHFILQPLLFLEPDAAIPQVCREGDGVNVCRGTQIIYQPTHGKPRKFTCVQRVDRLKILPPKAQTVQRVSSFFIVRFF